MPQSALLLGSGFVATPTVEVLTKAGISVTIACRTLASAEKLAAGFPHTRSISLDINDSTALEAEVAKHDITISLVPYIYHVDVVKAAIKAKKHVVTTSYVSPALQALDEEVKAAGITVMNEIGLDPGIDHLYAIDLIDRVHKEGGYIRAFRSFCCGIPAPENSDNPLGYKFSWSSRGNLLVLKNDARYFEDGKEVYIRGEDLMKTAKPYYTGFPGFNFVAYGNRDSTGYRERYNIPEAQTVIRGSLRYTGFPEFIKVLVDIGFFNEKKQDFLNEAIPWKDATAKILSSSSTSIDDLLQVISSKTTFRNTNEKNQIVAGLKWLGIFSDSKITPKGNPLDTLCALLEEKMAYEEGERDFVFLQHRFDIENKDGSKEIITSTLSEYGAPFGSQGHSAMSRLVGIPCAIAVKQVLDGTISTKGILAPLNPSINKPLMRELKEKYGIELKEKVIKE